MKTKKPVYLYQCVVCRKKMYTDNTTMRHCDRFTQWVAGIEGIGVNMKEKKIRIQVTGYIEMSESNLEKVLAYEDQHMGLVYAIPMGYCDASSLEFSIEE